MLIDFYCINLRTRPDRRTKIQQQFDLLNIKPKWWTVEKHPEGGIIGCFESHTNIWKHALTQNADWICVFEDDVHTETPELFHDTVNRLPDLPECDILYLNPFTIKLTEYLPHGFERGTFLFFGCYMIHRSKLQKVLDYVLPQKGRNIDIAAVGLNHIGRHVFDQTGDESDIGYRVSPANFKRIEKLINTVPLFSTFMEYSITWNRANPSIRDMFTLGEW